MFRAEVLNLFIPMEDLISCVLSMGISRPQVALCSDRECSVHEICLENSRFYPNPNLSPFGQFTRVL